jgi:hypothetical protein
VLRSTGVCAQLTVVVTSPRAGGTCECIIEHGTWPRLQWVTYFELLVFTSGDSYVVPTASHTGWWATSQEAVRGMTPNRARARGGAAAVAAAGLIATGVIAASSGPASAADAAGGLQQLSSNTLVSGTVVNGTAPVVGAVITPRVWPDDDALAAIPQGGNVPLLDLPSVKSGSNGNFQVNLDPSTLPAKYLDSKGRPDIQLEINNAGRQITWRFTADRSSAGWTSTKNATDASVDGSTPPNETLVANFGSQAKVTEVDGDTANSFSAGKMSPSQAESAGDTAETSNAVDTMAAPLGGACGVMKKSLYTNRQEPFTHIYPGGQAPVVTLQRYGVDHTLGIAISIQGGAWGGGSAGGSKTIALTASGSHTDTHNLTAFISLNFREYLEQCSSGSYEQWRQAESVYGILTRYDAAAEPNFTACSQYTSGLYSKTTGVNITYHSDVNVIVANVNAQSGYNSSSAVSWKVLHKTNICGSNSTGWVNSPEAEANSYAYP